MPDAVDPPGADSVLTKSAKPKLQLMRVQIRLHGLGLRDGRIDGIRNAQAVEALDSAQAAARHSGQSPAAQGSSRRCVR